MYSCNRDVEPEHWAKFRDAINATGRPMVFSIIAQGQKESWIWGNATGNLWRTTHDIMNSFDGFVSNLDLQESVPSIEHFAGPGSWNG
jgi:alpha-galactosidase